MACSRELPHTTSAPHHAPLGAKGPVPVVRFGRASVGRHPPAHRPRDHKDRRRRLGSRVRRGMRQRVCDTRSLCRSVNRVPILPLLAVGVDGFSVGLAGETSVVTSVVQQEEAGSATGCPVDRLMMDADQALRDENSLEPLHASHRVYLLPVDFGTSCAFTALANTACAGAGCVAFLRDVRPKGCNGSHPSATCSRGGRVGSRRAPRR